MNPRSWLLLVHQIPSRPLYLRARIRTLLARSGAVPLRKSVYVLPLRSGARERLDAVASEIRRGGGEAFVCEARFGAEDEHQLVEAARAARRREYVELTSAVEALLGDSGSWRRLGRSSLRARLPGLRRQLEAIEEMDAFHAGGRREAAAAVQRLEQRAARTRGADATPALRSPWEGRTWVTRAGVHVDRIACAWFVRRFLDAAARFRFVTPGRALRPDELGFDMPGGTFSHEDGRCSLETLVARTGPRDDAALRRVADIVHDLDLRDGRHRHPETAGVEQVLAGMLAACPEDEERLARGAALFDDLYRSFLRKPVISFPRLRGGQP